MEGVIKLTANLKKFTIPIKVSAFIQTCGIMVNCLANFHIEESCGIQELQVSLLHNFFSMLMLSLESLMINVKF